MKTKLKDARALLELHLATILDKKIIRFIDISEQQYSLRGHSNQ